MDDQLFRQKSLDRISSPEQLHDYMRVTGPKLWMILGAITVLLIGFIVYACTARMENTMAITVKAESIESYSDDDGETVTGRNTYYSAELPSSVKDVISNGMVVRLGNENGKINGISILKDPTDGSEKIRIQIGMDNPNYDLPGGEYEAVLVLESTTPISFLWN